MALILLAVSWMNTEPMIVSTTIGGRSVHAMFSRDPTCQRKAACMSSELAVSMITVVSEPKNMETAVPARRMVAGLSLLEFETAVMTATGMSEKTKALRTTAYSPEETEAPRTMASTAPRQAPEDTPVV